MERMSKPVNTPINEKKKLIVVLGAGINPDGTLYESAKVNVEKGVEIFNRDELQTTIFSGKWNFFLRVEPPKSEAKAMQEYALQLGVPADKTIIEEQSYDTVGCAYYIDKIIKGIPDVGLITLVTSSWHMPKASFIFEKVFGGDRFQIVFEEGKIELPKDMQEQMEVQESKKLEKLIEIYGKLRAGDNEGFAKLVEAKHPFYAVDKSKISEAELRRVNNTVPTTTYIK